MKRSRKRKITRLAVAVIVGMTFFSFIGFFMNFASVTPDKATQKKVVAARQSAQSYATKGTELRVAYGEEGPTEPRIVRIAPLPNGGHEILQDLGKIK